METPEGVVQEHFRIPVDLSVRIADAAHEKRCSKRALWIAAMEAYLSQATEPTGKAGR